jgi:hypothetical protein
MTLTNAKAPYLTIRDAIITLLKANLTSLNTDLTTALTVTKIKAGDPMSEPVGLDSIPSIYVRFDGKPEEDFFSFGKSNSPTKKVKMQYRIFGLARRTTTVKESDDEMTYLGRNIESVLRDNCSISGSVEYSNPSSMDLAIGIGDKAFISVATVVLDCWTIVE